jgi:small subunit ribosomal protein S7
MYSKIRDRYFTIGTAVEPDPVYHSILVSILINRVMKSGKKALATRIVIKALKRIKQSAKKHPVDVLAKAVMKAAPQIQLKSSSARKTRRRTKLVPVEIPGFKSTKIGIKWLVDLNPGISTGTNFVLRLVFLALEDFSCI